jgi:hypothetical protein
MKGRDLPSGQQPKELPKAKEEPWKKDLITEFDSPDDWMLSMILVALMHASPGMSPEDAVKEGKLWARKLAQPRMEHRWRKQTTRIKRSGIRAEASKIRREMFKLI